jgi:hypothetical protein
LKHKLLGVRKKLYILRDFSTEFHSRIHMYSRTILIVILILSSYMQAAFCSEPEFILMPASVSCNGKTDGSLSVKVLNISSPHTIRIIKECQNDTIFRSIDNENELALQNLKAGTVKLDLLLNNEIILSSHALITEPSALTGNKIQIVKAPSAESACDGVLLAEPSGGKPPYSFLWSENAGSSSDSRVNNICMGIYRCQINDSNNCGPVYISIAVLKNTLKKTSDTN